MCNSGKSGFQFNSDSGQSPLIQFRFQFHPWIYKLDFSLRFNSNSNSIGPKIPGIPIPVPIPESELHITGLDLLLKFICTCSHNVVPWTMTNSLGYLFIYLGTVQQVQHLRKKEICNHFLYTTTPLTPVFTQPRQWVALFALRFFWSRHHKETVGVPLLGEAPLLENLRIIEQSLTAKSFWGKKQQNTLASFF